MDNPKLATEQDLDQIWAWNSDLPDSINDRCIHDLIKSIVEKQPEEIAVDAWDGRLSYSELDRCSTQLARKLLSKGVGPGSAEPVIPLCFEKSKWTSIAFLAVMKAGGTATALDVSTQPHERLASTVEQTKARLILCSTATSSRARAFGGDAASIIDIEDELGKSLGEDVMLAEVAPEQTLFITFTSGSTGTPKGACISHANACTAVQYQGRRLGFLNARVLDFAPFSFDVAWSNMLHTFCAGGCLCIPTSDDMMADLAGCIDQYAVTLVNITPTMLRTLDRHPSSLKSVLLSGEPPGYDLLANWARLVQLFNTYGPAECTFKSTFAEVHDQSEYSSSNIGKGVGAVTWLAHPNDVHQLVAVGEVGELLLEGPLVGQGYLCDDERTAAAFLKSPKWLSDGRSGPAGKQSGLYRTGDLARYAEDGSLVFVGRKDRQVKIRGCRVEIGEVEHHLRQSLPDGEAAEIAAEVCKAKGTEEGLLVAFSTSTAIDEIEERLQHMLPRYMMPSAYIHIKDALPRTPTGKTDRKRLREIVSECSLEQLMDLSTRRSTRALVTDPKQRHLQWLWSKILDVDAQSIGPNTSFFQLGGDSIQAIRLVRAAKQQGLHFTVSEIFQTPKLCGLSEIMREHRSSRTICVDPFSLIQGIEKEAAQRQAAETCAASVEDIVDIFPCTPFQAGLMAETAWRPGSNVSVRHYSLQEGIDPNRFRRAWNEVVSELPILRTRIIQLTEGNLVQVVLQGEAEWLDAGSIIGTDAAKSIGFGTPLPYFSLSGRSSNGTHSFALMMHHAVFDGWSRSLIMGMLEKAYFQEPRELLRPFQDFVHHVARQAEDEEATKAWRKAFEGLTAEVFPALPSRDYRPHASNSLVHDVKNCAWRISGITAPTIIEAAWALLISMYTNADDVVFGEVLTGRDSFEDADRVAGPTAVVIPQRIPLHSLDETVTAFLHRLTQRKIAMKPFEQVGLANIRRLSPEADQACNFQTLLVVHPEDSRSGPPSRLFQQYSEKDQERSLNDCPNTYALSIACQLKPDGLLLTTNFDSAVIDRPGVQRMLDQFDVVLRQLNSPLSGNKKLADISGVSISDMQAIQSWNAHIPEPMVDCVHTLLSQTAEERPDAPAVHAWDGGFSYGKLESLSTYVAESLRIRFEIGRHDIIPLCFEKSRLMPLAVLSVMKAGAASVMIDVTQPWQRLSSIAGQLKPRMALASSANMELASIFAPNPQVIDFEALLKDQTAQQRSETTRTCEPYAKPEDPLCVVFTSGSSGEPKGIVLTHANLSSALIHQNKALGFGSDSRTFDFASYSFDAAYYNCLHTLYAGGCLCIPSEHDRRENLSGSICRLQASFANLTPRVAELLDDNALKQLDYVELSGETADDKVVARLRQHTKVRFAYGPAECSVMSTVSAEDAKTSNIGRGLGVCCWVVDTRTSAALSPVGCVGELWIEGPLVGAGYLRDAEKTSASFFEDPPWLMEAVGRRGRVYHTGDLVKYNTDGTIAFMGRNDSQRKIRGQRIELREVASVVKKCLNITEPHRGANISVIAEVVVPRAGGDPQLIAFITPQSAPSMTAHEVVSAVRDLISGTEERMISQVPSYMIPSVFIPIDRVPLTATGKIDQQHLRRIVEEYHAVVSPVRPSTQQLTSTEMRLRAIWASVLKTDERRIGQETSFWSMGDSISAMSLVFAVRREFNIQLRLSSMTRQHTTLRNLSSFIDEQKEHVSEIAASPGSIRAELKAMTRELRAMVPNHVENSQDEARPLVLLTGSTGFLGTQILCDLLAKGCFDKVVVLVRAIDADDGLSRVRKTAMLAGWWRESCAKSIEIWVGDLSKDQLGLNQSQWDRLVGRSSREPISTIIHNGAAVHWIAGYDELQPVNVGSTFQLLKAALQSPALRRMVYVSGGRASDQDDDLLLEDEDVSGYVKTKGVSERLVLAMACHATGQPDKFAVVKPGLIIADSNSDVVNADDFLWRMVASCTDARAFPAEDGNSWLPIADVASVSQHVLRQTLDKHIEAFNVVAHGLPTVSFWRAVEEGLGVSLVETDMAAWKELMQKRIQEVREDHPLWPVQQFIGAIGIERAKWAGEQPNWSATGELKMKVQLEQAIIRNAQNLAALKGKNLRMQKAEVLGRSKFVRPSEFLSSVG